MFIYFILFYLPGDDLARVEEEKEYAELNPPIPTAYPNPKNEY